MDKIERSVCIIGAGFSGLCTAIKLQQTLPHFNLTIFDENSDFGGTWLVNIYPGCSCDIPSHLYSLSFEPNPSWSSVYPSQTEMLSYIKNLAKKHCLYKIAKFHHKVKSVQWEETTLKWNVIVEAKNTDHLFTFDFVFCGTGEYHLPKVPEIFSPFQGAMMHAAEWQPEIGLEGKHVAVVGSGSSAIQIIPSIVSKVGKLLSYQRTPPWVIHRRQFNIPAGLQWIFAHIPGIQKLYRTGIYLAHEVGYPVFQIRGVLTHIARPIAKMLGKLQLQRQVRDANFREKLKPKYSLGCSRVCLSNEYYPALCKEHVEVIRDDIVEVTHDSIVTKDRHDKIDVLILATGFHIGEYFGPMEILGRKRENILRKWKVDGPSIYLGIVSELMPNLFFIHGPGVDLGHNTGLFTIECQVNWVMQMIKEMERQGASAVCVKKSVEDNYMAKHYFDMKNTIWARNECNEYYANSQSILTIVYPRSQIDYWARTKSFNQDNFDFIHEK